MIAQISKAKPINTIIGASVILLKLKMAGLNSFGLSAFHPIIRRNPIIMIIKPIIIKI
jgi:hypothetical protein